jgi:hypothetical protein
MSRAVANIPHTASPHGPQANVNRANSFIGTAIQLQ